MGGRLYYYKRQPANTTSKQPSQHPLFAVQFCPSIIKSNCTLSCSPLLFPSHHQNSSSLRGPNKHTTQHQKYSHGDMSSNKITRSKFWNEKIKFSCKIEYSFPCIRNSHRIATNMQEISMYLYERPTSRNKNISNE